MRLGIVLRFFGTIVVFAALTSAILGGEATPTPAPTKTPEPEVTEPPAPENEEQAGSPALTQADLSVLTGNVQRPNGFGWHDGQLYAVCNGDWTVYRLDDTTGATITYIYGVRNAHSMIVDAPGDSDDVVLWIPDYDTDQLLRVDQTGAPEPIASELGGPWGIAVLDEKQFLLTSLGENALLSVSREGDVREIATGLRSPTGLVVTADYIFVANNGSARRSIEWIEREAVEDTTNDGELEMKPLVQGLQNTTGLALGADGYLYFAYALGTRGVVGRVLPENCTEEGCSNDQVEIVLYTELAAPLAGLTITPDMRLYVHTIFRPEVYWVQLEEVEQDE